MLQASFSYQNAVQPWKAGAAEEMGRAALSGAQTVGMGDYPLLDLDTG